MITKLNTGNIQPGELYTWLELCQKLGEMCKTTGKSKILQRKRFEKLMQLEDVGKKVKVIKIYDHFTPTTRKLHAGKYIEPAQAMLLTKFRNDAPGDYHFCLYYTPAKTLLDSLGLCNSNLLRWNSINNFKFDSDLETEDVLANLAEDRKKMLVLYAAKRLCWQIAKGTLVNILDTLERRKYIFWQTVLFIPEYEREPTRAQRHIIRDAQMNALCDLGFRDERAVWFKKKQKEYKELTLKYIKSIEKKNGIEDGIPTFKEVYRIEFTPLSLETGINVYFKENSIHKLNSLMLDKANKELENIRHKVTEWEKQYAERPENTCENWLEINELAKSTPSEDRKLISEYPDIAKKAFQFFLALENEPDQFRIDSLLKSEREVFSNRMKYQQTALMEELC